VLSVKQDGLTFILLVIGFLVSAVLVATVGHSYYVEQAIIHKDQLLPDRAPRRGFVLPSKVYFWRLSHL
jgi:hypothetical protein